MGKRGGYRTVTFFSGTALPVFLITVFAKGQKSNLTQAEINQLSKISAAILEQHGGKLMGASGGR